MFWYEIVETMPMLKPMPPTEFHALHEAVERLYEVFARYPLITPVTGCPCCTTPADYAMLASKPLRQLTAKDLRKYATKALTTWGDVNDFRHFLPRLFEAMFFDNLTGEVNAEIVFDKLPYGEWRTWPQAEQDAIEQMLPVLWQTRLDTFPSFVNGHYDLLWADDVEECLCSIGQLVEDVSPFLATWLHTDSASAIYHLAQFANSIVYHNGKVDGYWQPSQRASLLNWLTNPLTLDTLETGFLTHFDELTIHHDEFRPEVIDFLFVTLGMNIDWLRTLKP